MKFSHFVLDSCIIEYITKRYLITSLRVLFSNWVKEYGKPKLSFSEISSAELLDSAYKEKEYKILQLLEKFEPHSISTDILLLAGRMGSIYKQKNITENISLADKIIASTAYLHHIPVITANGKDFPAPYFSHIAHQNIKYRKKLKSKEQILPIYLCLPNYEAISCDIDGRK